MKQDDVHKDVHAACEGDEQAFATLVHAHQQTVVGIAYAITQSHSAVDDLVQDTFLVAWRNLGSLKQPEQFSAWLCTIARNLSKNWIRSEVYRRALKKAYAENLSTTSIPSGYRELMQSERYARLRKMLESVSAPSREVMVLFYLEEFSIKEIAGILEISTSSAKKRLQRGRKQFRDSFEDDWRAQLNDDIASEEQVTGKVMATLAIGPAMPLPTYTSGALSAVPTSFSLSPVSTTLWKGVLTMSAKKVLVSASIVLLCLLGGFYLMQSPPEEALKDSPPPSQSALDTDSQIPKKIMTISPQESELPPIENTDTEIILATKNTPDEKNDDEATPDTPIITTISGTIYDEWDTPAAGAEVILALGEKLDYVDPNRIKIEQQLTMSQSENQYRTVSDQTGQYVISGEFSHSAGMLIAKSSIARGSKVLSVDTEESMENIDVIIEGGVSLWGQVLDANNQPIPDAFVMDMASATYSTARGYSNMAGSLKSTFTDAQGMFEFFYSGSGVAAVHVTAEEGHAFFFNVAIGEKELIPLQLPMPGSLSGVITRSDASPVDGVWITLDSSFTMTNPSGGQISNNVESIYKTKTLADGSYSFPQVASGMKYSATVTQGKGITMDDLVWLSPEIQLGEIAAEEAKHWDYSIQDVARITGVVRGEPSGKPLAGVQIRLEGGSATQATTDSKGFYEMTTPVGDESYFIYPRYPGMAQNFSKNLYSEEIEINYGDEIEYSCTLPDPGSVRLKVISPLGEVIEGAKVSSSFSYSLGKGSASTGFHPIGKTNAEGLFEWSMMPPAGKTKFQIQSEVHNVGRSKEYRGEAGAVFPEEVIVLYEKSGIEGYAVDSEGKPLAFASLIVRVFIGDTRVVVAMATSAEDGYFIIKDKLVAAEVDIVLNMNNSSSESVRIPVVLEANKITNLGNIEISEHE